MAKVNLTTLLGGIFSTSSLNSNFSKIADELDDKVLYRNNPAGEDNSMLNSLDMNSNRIINVPTPVANTDGVNKSYVDNIALSGAVPSTDRTYNFVTDFGGVADGVKSSGRWTGTDNTSAWASMVTQLTTDGGGTVYIPDGTYVFAHQAGQNNLICDLPDNITIIGESMYGTVLAYDLDPSEGVDNKSNWAIGKNPSSTDRTFGTSGYVHLSRFTIEGLWEDNPTKFKVHALNIRNIADVVLQNIHFKNIQGFASTSLGNGRFVVDGCHFYQVGSDGARSQATPFCQVTNNLFHRVDDDCVALHAYDDPSPDRPVREGIVVTGNIVENSEGIKINAANKATVSDNVLIRPHGTGIGVHFGGSPEGAGSKRSIQVCNNSIVDHIRRYFSTIESYDESAGDVTVGQTLISFTNYTYTVGDSSWLLYKNNTLLTLGVDYTETSTSSFTLTTPVAANDVFVVKGWGQSTTGSISIGGSATTGTDFESFSEGTDITAGSNVAIDLSFTYTTGNNSLRVYRNGSLLTVTTDYVETDSDTVTINTVSSGDVIEVSNGTPPGEYDITSAAVVDPLTTGAADVSSDDDQLSDGAADVVVSGNTICRTHATADNYSDWGHGQYFHFGAYQGPASAGLLDPKVTADAFAPHAILVTEDCKNTVISNNTVSGYRTGAGVFFFQRGNTISAWKNFKNILITGNTFFDTKWGVTSGRKGSNTVLAEWDIHIVNNLFDGDPYVLHSDRNGVDGTWDNVSATAETVFGVNLTGIQGVVVKGNSFRNVYTPIIPYDLSLGQAVVVEGNICYCDPTDTGYNASNVGVGEVPFAGPHFTHVIVDDDPTSSNWGKLKNYCPLQLGSAPNSGTFVEGHIVYKQNTTTSDNLVGWKRLTTGSGHVIGTDWLELTSGVREVDTTSSLPAGSNHDVTGIPANATELFITIAGVSGSSNATLEVQLGDSGGIETTGYTGVVSDTGASSTLLSTLTGFRLDNVAVNASNNRFYTIHMVRRTANTWNFTAQGGDNSGGRVSFTTGYKTLTTGLTTLRFLLSAGNFDAGTIAVHYR